jgi:TrmH family RNA methyltransferase
MEIITSKSNDKVKFLKSLNEKKGRLANNCFYLEGIKVVKEVLDMKEAVNVKFIAYSSSILKSKSRGKEILKIICNTQIPVIELAPEILEYVCNTKTPQGIIAVIAIKEKKYIDMVKDGGNILLLDAIQDPGNIGTIIRTCDAFNIKNVVYTEGTTDIYAPKVVRSTMASICRVSFVKLDFNVLDKFKEIVKNNGYKIIGTSLRTDNFVEEYKFNNKNILVFSNEASGISSEIEKICNDLVKIRMSDTAESLNVGVAAGIILHKLYQN